MKEPKERRCAVCGRLFASPYPQTRTCSDACRQIWSARWHSKYIKNYVPPEGRKAVKANKRACLKRKMEVPLMCHPLEGDCDKCGWNPKVERERIRKRQEGRK